MRNPRPQSGSRSYTPKPVTPGNAGKVAGLGRKFGPQLLNAGLSFIPGGAVAKGALNSARHAFNDPEWWEHEKITSPAQTTPLINQRSATVDSNGNFTARTYRNTNKPWMLEILPPGANYTPGNTDISTLVTVVDLPEDLISMFPLAEVRRKLKVLSLEDITEYSINMNTQITLVAFYHQVNKIIYMCDNPAPHLPALQATIPVMLPANYPGLLALKNMLGNILRDYVKLPSTLSHYLAWRYGRQYLSHDDQLAARVQYNVIPFASTLTQYQDFLTLQYSRIQATARAGADFMETFKDHVQVMQVEKGTEVVFDYKEQHLRWNAFGTTPETPTGVSAGSDSPSTTSINVSISEPAIELFFGEYEPDTLALSSTISTSVRGPGTEGILTALFPVRDDAFVWTAWSGPVSPTAFYNDAGVLQGAQIIPTATYSSNAPVATRAHVGVFTLQAGPIIENVSTTAIPVTAVMNALYRATLAQQVGLYNFYYVAYSFLSVIDNRSAVSMVAANYPAERSANVAKEVIKQFKQWQVANLFYAKATHFSGHDVSECKELIEVCAADRKSVV